MRPTAPGALWRLRSFTPAGIEVFGAGHNAMGAWLWLALTDRLPAAAGRYRQQIGDDVLGVEVGRTAGRVEVTSPMASGSPASSRARLARESTAAEISGEADSADATDPRAFAPIAAPMPNAAGTSAPITTAFQERNEL
ncbi:hypothetical protein [Leifsonia aquatica]|uniref:hypothetical protein n=1 Tax=Leifsonia aquatica TaxID=144185 RepID=UPI0006945F1E|nr:hypothetical protein [Leifsonia aquatica]